MNRPFSCHSFTLCHNYAVKRACHAHSYDGEAMRRTAAEVDKLLMDYKATEYDALLALLP